MIAVDAIAFHSIAAFSAGCPSADAESPPTATAWVWATVVIAARFMAASAAPRTSVRASLDMVGSDRSTGALRATDWLPPATARPPPSPARRASATRQPRIGGLLPPLGDALLGQDLAQPGMLVVHGSSPSALPFFWWRSATGCRWPAQDGPAGCFPNPACALRRRLAAPHLWTPAPSGRRFPPAGHGG